MDIITPKRPILDLLKKHVELWDILVDRPNTPNISGDMIFNKISIKLDLEKNIDFMLKNMVYQIIFLLIIKVSILLVV